MSLERFNKAVTGEQSKPQLAIIGAIDCQNNVDSTRFIGVTPRPGTPREPHLPSQVLPVGTPSKTLRHWNEFETLLKLMSKQATTP
jgi:hypothetical protein